MNRVIRVLEEAAQGERILSCGATSARLKQKVEVLLHLAMALESYMDTSTNGKKLASYQFMTREATIALLALGLLGLRGHPSEALDSAWQLCDELVRHLEAMTGESF